MPLPAIPRPLPRLNHLPDDLLLLIFSNLVDQNRLLLDDSNPYSLYAGENAYSGNRNLKNVSLTCKSFMSVAQELLFHTIVVFDINEGLENILYNEYELFRLVITLVQKPHLRDHIRQLRVNLAWMGFSTKDLEANLLNAQMNIFNALDKIELRKDVRHALKKAVVEGNRWPPVTDVISPDTPKACQNPRNGFLKAEYLCLFTTLLALTPKLQRLSIKYPARQRPHDDDPRSFDQWYGQLVNPFGIVPLRIIHLLPGFDNLRYLKIPIHSPAGLVMVMYLPNLSIVDLVPGGDTSHPGLDQDQDLIPISADRFDHIEHLRRCCTASFQDHNEHTEQPVSLLYLFRSLRTLDIYADSQRSLEEEPTLLETLHSMVSKLLSVLDHLDNTLETLRLPVRNGLIKPTLSTEFTSFVNFAALKTLIVPQEILVVEYRNETKLSNLDNLPPTLQTLRIFAADKHIFDWLDTWFEDENHLPRLRQIEVLFGPKYLEDDLMALKKGQIRKSFWKMVKRSRVRFVLERDEEVPAWSPLVM